MNYDDLKSRYSEPHRFYHTIDHIKECLNVLKLVENQLDFPDEVRAAIWYHDAIHNTKKGGNEEQSARLASVHLNGSGLDIDLVMKLILVTKHPSYPKTNDEKYMIDIDLAILGYQPKVYLEYSKNIRKEYSHVSDKQYRHGRKIALNSFLRMPFIYKTDHFKSILENNARRNIESEISSL